MTLDQLGPAFTQVVATPPYDTRPCPSAALVGNFTRVSITFVEEEPSHLTVSQDSYAFDSEADAASGFQELIDGYVCPEIKHAGVDVTSVGFEATAVSFPDDPFMYVVLAHVHEYVGTYLFQGQSLPDRTADLLKIVAAGSLRMSPSSGSPTNR